MFELIFKLILKKIKHITLKFRRIENTKIRTILKLLKLSYLIILKLF
jgi:hypothetical protein